MHRQSRTSNNHSDAPRKPRHQPGEENPSWGRSFVTVSRFEQWPELEASGIPIPTTLTAGPGLVGERVTVSLGEHPWPKKGDSAPLKLSIRFFTAMRGWQEAEGPISVEQALSFEEGVRAVFEAARARGLLPARYSVAKRGKPMRKT